MEKLASQALSAISELVKDNPKLVGSLLAGAGVAGTAAGMASAGKKDPAESKSSRRLRILRNALLGGAAGAGVVGLGTAGYKSLSNALPVNDTDPATGIFTSPLGRLITGGAAGGAAWAAGRPKRERAAKGLLSAVDPKSVNDGANRDTLKNVVERGSKIEAGGPATAGFGQSVHRLFGKLNSDREQLHQGMIRAGLDPHSLGHEYRFSDMLPPTVRDKYRATTGFIADKAKHIPGASKLDMTRPDKARKALSRFAFRHPAVAGLTAAGLLAPEVVSAAGTLAEPVIPNLYHR